MLTIGQTVIAAFFANKKGDQKNDRLHCLNPPTPAQILLFYYFTSFHILIDQIKKAPILMGA